MLRDDPAAYSRLFARARAEVGYATCLCRPSSELRLVIRCTRAGTYHVAGWPGEGERHTPGCSFHKVARSLTGRSGYSTEAIKESGVGVSIRFAEPLRRLRRQREAGPGQHGTAVSSPSSRRAVGLLGLLHWMWEEAQLATWHPGRQRSWTACYARLREEATGCSINRQDLTTVLHIVPPYRPQAADSNAALLAAFEERLGHHGASEYRGLMLGEIKAVAPTPYGARFSLAHQRRPLFASAALAERVRRSYPHAFAEAAGERARRVALCLVDRHPKGYLTVSDMAVMLTNRSYIPADSSYEVTMAEQLAAAGRTYIKPLRYDTSEEVFPDFVLLDTTPYTYVEVYGVRGKERYEQRKQAKKSLYRNRGIPVIEWDVTDPMPTLSSPRLH